MQDVQRQLANSACQLASQACQSTGQITGRLHSGAKALDAAVPIAVSITHLHALREPLKLVRLGAGQGSLDAGSQPALPASTPPTGNPALAPAVPFTPIHFCRAIRTK